jgi:hypothetical protein
MYEVGFVGDWIEPPSHLSLNWCYAFDRRVFELCTTAPQIGDNNELRLVFKFALDPERKVVLSSLLSGDIALLTVFELENIDRESLTRHSKSMAIPISRYVPFKKLCENMPNSFRNLKELSIKLKDELLLAIRNEIYRDRYSPTPCLTGMPDIIVIKIFKYLPRKADVHNVRCSCRRLNDVYRAYVHNKKRKFE